MSAPLEKLLVLHDRDVSLRQITNDLNRIPAEEKQIELELAQQKKHFEELKLQSQKLESQRKQLEMDVKDRQAKIAKYRTQQYETKKNEEYQALTVEIERTEKEVVSLEDQELELMEAYDQAQKAVSTESVKVKEFEKKAEEQKTRLKTKQASLQERQQSLQAELPALEQDVPPPLLQRYRRILANKGDMAIAPITNGNMCGGCHMKLTPQTAIEAKSNTEPATCEQCGRFLFWPTS